VLSEREVSAAIGTTAYGHDGEKLGTVEHFFTDDRTGAPTWVALLTGPFGTRSSIVPAVEATLADGTLRLPFSAAAVRSAPPLGGEHLGAGEEATLRRHYGLDVPVGGGAPWTATGEGLAPTADQGAPPASPDDGAMTRSEERLRVGTERVPATRVRLVKYVVTEEVQVTVPLRREEVRVEEVSLDAPDTGRGEGLVADAAPSGGLPDEMVLHAERPVVSVEVVPTERVRVRVEQVPGQESVTDRVQRERIVVDQDGSHRREPGR
jgi:uncharacterized protein (TIGR02271 family)